MASSLLTDSSVDRDTLPLYDSIDHNSLPPEYSSAVHHISLVYYNDESRCNGKVSYIPLLFEINSTQINLYHLKAEYSRYIAYLYNDLHSKFVDPNLNIKSKHPTKLNIMGQGIGSSTSLFNIPDYSSSSNSNTLFNSIAPAIPPTMMTSSDSSSSTLSSMFSSNTSTNPFSTYGPSSSRSNSASSCSTSSSFSKFFEKLAIKKEKKEEEFSFNNIILLEYEKKSQDLIYLQKLLNYKPDINLILDTDYTPQEAQMLTFKSHLFKSFSLQELVKYGNASDFHSKPFALRLIFPTDQFILISYNANSYASIFYKLNIGRELSLDLDLRVALPTDYCVPRRSRARRRRSRHRINSFGSTASSLRTPNRSRSNSLLDQDDDEDEFDTTFNIDSNPHLDYQPQSSLQPQIILEDEILDDVIQLEPAQQTISSLSYVSRVTTTSNSVFSSVERFSSQATDLTLLSSLSPISSQNEDVDDNGNSIFDSTIAELPPIDKIPDDNHPQTKYKELVCAIKCIRSCKNKTVPWTK